MPASQLAHVPWPGCDCLVPGLHSVWSREPVEQDEPAGQAVHWAAAPSPMMLE